MKDEGRPVIDRLMPRYDAVERHELIVRAEPGRVYGAIRTANLARSPIVRGLLMARAGFRRRVTRATVEEFAFEGFRIVADHPPRELVIGLEGPFWKPGCRPHGVDAEAYGTKRPANTALAAWNFVVTPHEQGAVLSTETRVLCSDDAALRSFRRYWFFIRPFSGLIRRFMLRAIRDEAEGGGRKEG